MDKYCVRGLQYDRLLRLTVPTRTAVCDTYEEALALKDAMELDGAVEVTISEAGDEEEDEEG